MLQRLLAEAAEDTPTTDLTPPLKFSMVPHIFLLVHQKASLFHWSESPVQVLYHPALIYNFLLYSLVIWFTKIESKNLVELVEGAPQNLIFCLFVLETGFLCSFGACPGTSSFRPG